ncbi:chloride channel protein [Thermoflavifilum thermophilum]|uniref:Chloride channel protein, CIC family n=1 Tax=Thermoflavifilum thermophilum TaxID=1393122 RepID=A0A1I7NLP8_9BACT|nr:chloride channel protein [Thermoflavifilum thermophilum]SFV35549.1 chloride channel protein, CIC family [Thermoflavifilum thermophilum]
MQKFRSYFRFLRLLLRMQHQTEDLIQQHEIPLSWLKAKLTRQQFLILSGVLVGLTTGFASVLLKTIVHFITVLITHDYHFRYQLMFYLIFPFCGLMITALVVHYLFKGKDGKGIAPILHEIANHSARVPAYKMYRQIIASGITVGFGGSAGLESPIAVTGAAIGSNYATTYGLPYKDRTLLLAAGSAAGIASAFNAPIAGVMFAIEIILAGVVFSDFIPLIIASVAGALVSKMILNEQILLHFNLQRNFDYRNTPFYLLLGICCGLYSRYYALMAHRVDRFFKRFQSTHTIRKAMVGGVMLALCCFVFPPLFGDGYGFVKTLANEGPDRLMQISLFAPLIRHQWALLAFVGSIALVKVFATSTTIYAGGSGGNFAPSLFAGAFVGYFFSRLMVDLHLFPLPVANFTIVGMAGVMSGVLYAPLTSIFLIAEVTGGYDLFIPLMIVSTASYLIVKRFSPYSLEISEYVREGKIFTRRYDSNILSMLQVKDLVDCTGPCIRPHATWDEILAAIQHDNHLCWAVTDEQNHLLGIITFEDLKTHIFPHHNEKSGCIAEKLMKQVPVTVQIHENMNHVMEKFDASGQWCLPVLQGEHYMGMLSKSAVLDAYRITLKHSMEG